MRSSRISCKSKDATVLSRPGPRPSDRSFARNSTRSSYKGASRWRSSAEGYDIMLSKLKGVSDIWIQTLTMLQSGNIIANGYKGVRISRQREEETRPKGPKIEGNRKSSRFPLSVIPDTHFE